MTVLKGRKLYIEDEKPDRCELCGKVAELRPYGPKGERVCFSCGMKDEKAASAAFQKLLDQADEVIDGRPVTIIVLPAENR